MLAHVRGGAPSEIPLLVGREGADGHAAAYVCEHFTCRLPVTDADALREELGDVLA